MIPRRPDAKPDLFRISLRRVIDMEHALVELAGRIDWEHLRREVEPCFCEDNGRRGEDVRLVLGLF